MPQVAPQRHPTAARPRIGRLAPGLHEAQALPEHLAQAVTPAELRLPGGPGHVNDAMKRRRPCER